MLLLLLCSKVQGLLAAAERAASLLLRIGGGGCYCCRALLLSDTVLLLLPLTCLQAGSSLAQEYERLNTRQGGHRKGVTFDPAPTVANWSHSGVPEQQLPNSQLVQFSIQVPQQQWAPNERQRLVATWRGLLSLRRAGIELVTGADMQSLVPSTAAAGGSAVSPGSTHFTAAAAHRAPAHDAGAAAAAAAAQQSKLKAQKKRHAELLAAALTPPPQRDQAQVEALCDWLTTSHLLHALQPTAIRSLAQAMTTQAFAPGEVIYRQGEAARHLFILLSGMVCMFESGAGTPADAAASRAGSPPAHAHHQRAGFSAGGSRAQHSSGSARHHRSIRSGPGSRAGTAAGASSSSSSSSTGADSSTAAAVAAQQAEVRRVWPKEAFGEDDVTDRCVREQTAVAGTATAATFKQHSTSSSSGDGGGGGGGGGASGGPASQPGDATTSSSGGSGGGQAAAALTAAAAVAGADLSSHAVVLMLSADDYGAALQGRMSSLLEEKVCVAARVMLPWCWRVS
jgi:CRP-like cAMP-binding protein